MPNDDMGPCTGALALSLLLPLTLAHPKHPEPITFASTDSSAFKLNPVQSEKGMLIYISCSILHKG